MLHQLDTGVDPGGGPGGLVPLLTFYIQSFDGNLVFIITLPSL